MNPGLCTTLLLIYKPLRDEWATKGHTHRNEPRINVIYMGQFKDERVMGILAKKLTSDRSDTVAKCMVQAFNCGPKGPRFESHPLLHR